MLDYPIKASGAPISPIALAALPTIVIFYIASALNFFFGFFIWMKSPRKLLNFFFGLTAFFIGVYTFGCASEWLTGMEFLNSEFWDNIAVRISWTGVLTIPTFYATSSLIAGNFKRSKFLIILSYALGVALVIITWTTSYIIIPPGDPRYTNIDDTPPGPLSIYGRIYNVVCMIPALYNLIAGFRRSTGFRRLQLKYFIFGISLFGLFTLICVGIIPVVFGVEQYADWPVPFSVIWMGFTGFAIIRYRLMEIDTVIHRTILWVLTSLLIMVPVYFFFYLFRGFLFSIPVLVLSLITLGWFFLYGSYRRYIQPGIDHLFRRRRYDYYNVLSELGQKIGTELELGNLLNRLFKELKDIFYVRSILVLVKMPEQKKKGFEEVGSTGREKAAPEQEQRTDIVLDENHRLYQWITRNRKAVLKDEVRFNPDYDTIRNEALFFFESNDLEILVPLILENEAVGIIGLGKKGTLQNYTIKDIDLLEQLGRQTGITIDNALHHADIIEKERMEEEFKLGRQIQSALLPQKLPKVKGLEVHGMMEVAKEIGGDYYDFISLPEEDNLAVVIGDVSGKGLVPGLFMAMVKSATHIFSQQERSPRRVLSNINDIFNQQIGQDKFMTMVYLVWQADKSMVTYSSAGYENILIYRDEKKEIETVQPGGMILGIVPDIEKMLEEQDIRLKPRDRILLYTDGVVEASNSSEERFGLERLKGSFLKYNQRTAEELIQSIREDVYSFIHPNSQMDDLTLVVLEAQA